ncbi:MAG: aminotransferase class I/II-fold pyridoxal phosphate-dependent enzyme [Lentisphaeria bacterium]|nr:aminotransferase class I/II-fold pyridoxal phosphate-dependent enzyme [Lentisphaeria bacterium]
MKLSDRAAGLTPSEPRRIYDAAQKYSGVIDLTLGDPDLPPPPNVREAACRAIEAGKTRYSANAGLPELRRAIAEDARKEYGMTFDPASEIIVTVGAMESAYLSLWSLLNAGDEAIIPAPYWINYGEVVRSLGAKPVFVETRPEDAFVVRPEEIEKRITAKTRLLVLNSPANPTGAVIPGETLDRIAGLVRKYDLAVVSDEIYSHLAFDGRKPESILTRPGMRERTAVVNGFSKRYAMTGWRVGWTLAPAPLIRVMTQMTENIVACAPLPSQYAAIEALSDRTDESYIRREFEKRRDCVMEELRSIPEITCKEIPATFYGFLDISRTGLSGEEFALQLLRSKQVALIHGSTYGGDAYRNFVRIAFTMDTAKLREAFARIREFLSELKAGKIR